MDDPLLRVSVPPYISIKPLVWALPEVAPEVQINESVPRDIARLIVEGEIDAGLLPLLTILRNPALSIIPDISVSHKGPAGNCILFSNVAPADIKTVLVDRSAIGAIALLRALFRIRWSMQPVEVISSGPLDSDYSFEDADYDAFLITGDEAMKTVSEKQFEHIIDLGEKWEEWTHLPFVFYVWAVAEDVRGPALEEMFMDAKLKGLERIEEIADYGAIHLEKEKQECLDYLKNTSYSLGEDEWKGIERFHYFMHELTICPEYVELLIYRGDHTDIRPVGINPDQPSE